MMVNWEFMDNMTPESATQLVDDLRQGQEVHSTRGAKICSWREAERVLAGFPDDRADEGPAAGPASLAGLQVARENGWKAPEAHRKAVHAAPERGGDAQGALFDSDTRRAGSETVVEQSPADVEGGKGSNPEADGKGTNE
jgi:NADH-quinone oxidoreductase subunit E